MLTRFALPFCLLAAPLAAKDLKIAVDTPPVLSLVAQVTDGIQTPELLVGVNASPHGHSLRPSEAARLQSADVLVWLGEEMSPWLAKARAEMAADAVSLSLLEAEGTERLMSRGAHHHDHGEEGHEEHGHDDHDDHEHKDAKAEDHDHDHKEEGHEHKHDDHEGHDHDEDKHDDHDHEGHDHDEDKHDDHDHEGHEHHAGQVDPHAWLSPDNATLWLAAIADSLSTADPENAEAYAANAAKATEAIKAQSAEISARLTPLATREFLVGHDAFQYFEAHFGLEQHGAVTDTEDSAAGPAHLRELLESGEEIACFVADPGTPKATVALVEDTLKVKSVTIDPLGRDLPLGKAHYAALLDGMATSFETCLKP